MQKLFSVWTFSPFFLLIIFHNHLTFILSPDPHWPVYILRFSLLRYSFLSPNVRKGGQPSRGTCSAVVLPDEMSASLSAIVAAQGLRQDSSTRCPFISDEMSVPRGVYSRSPSTKSSRNGHQVVLSLHVIYDADGTLAGELLYMAKKALGLAHCAACDITHGPRREKPEFTALKTTTGWTVPLLNIHRDEMDETMQVCVNGILPCVVARTDAGDFLLVRPNELDECAGSVDSFVYIVDERAKRMGLILKRAPNFCNNRIPSTNLASVHEFDPLSLNDMTFDDDAVVPS